MDWDMNQILWPTMYLLWAVAAIFFIWAMLKRNSRKNRDSWQDFLAIALFSLVSSLLMLFIHTLNLQVSFFARLGIVSLILCFYAYYSYRRNKRS